jgi:hypothetical protein
LPTYFYLSLNQLHQENFVLGNEKPLSLSEKAAAEAAKSFADRTPLSPDVHGELLALEMELRSEHERFLKELFD